MVFVFLIVDLYNDLVNTFLLTYRGFVSPRDLLEKLFHHYNPRPPKPLHSMNEREVEDYERTTKKSRLRIANILTRWLKNHYHDFASDEGLVQQLRETAMSTFGVNESSLQRALESTICSEMEV